MNEQSQGSTKSGDEVSEESPRPYTPWHYMAAAVFEYLLRPRGYLVEAFVKVGTLPLEIDIVVIRGPEARTLSFERLNFIFERLGAVTVIEYKGPTDELEIKDFDRLLAYSLLFRIKEKVERYADITTMTISSRITKGYRQALEAEGIEMVDEGSGVYRCEGAMFRHFAVALDELPEEAQSLPLLPLGHRRKAQFGALFRGSPEDLELGHYLWRVARGNKELLMQVLTDEDLRKGLDEIRREIVEQLTVEERLKGLGPEERLKGLEPEERLKGLEPEEILSALPDDVKRVLLKKLTQ